MTRTTIHRRGLRSVALVAATFAVLTVPSVLGVAVGGPLGATVAGASEAAAVPSTSPVMIVLDASGSMNETDAPGPRIDAAKAAVRDLVGGLPTTARVGLTVYGTHTGSSDAEKAAGCQDITQLAPVGEVDKPTLTRAVDGIVAKGYTPIGASLQKAAAALPKEGPRSIVLVSDGEDTCSPPPPCDVAAQLKAQGVDLIVHTVGFKVDETARQQLACIAAATGGTYSDAQDAGSLDTSLETQVSRALQPYDVQGEPIVGAAGPGGAPQLEPGQYTDTLANGGDDYGRSGPGKYYAVDLHEGETPYLSATVVPPAAGTGTNLNQMLLTSTLSSGAADSSGCSIREDAQSLSVQGKVLTTTVVMAPGAVGGPDWPPGCPTEGTFYFFVTRNFGGAGDLPTELAYRSEPAATDVSGLPAAVTDEASVPLPTPSTDVTALAGGASFNSAPEVASGQTYSDSVVFGEDRYFKVHLDWGQQLAFRFDTQHVDGLGETEGVQSRVYGASPVRAQLTDILSQTDVALPFLGGLAGQLAGSTSYPARWTNRESDDSDVQPYAIDGDYYLIFSAGYSSAGTKATVPYTVTVDVTGTKEDGPVYAQRVDPSKASTGSNGAGSNGAASNGASSNGSAQTTLSDSEPAGWTTQRTTLVGGSVGVAVLAAIVLGWVLLGRRRAPRPPAPPIMPNQGQPDDWR